MCRVILRGLSLDRETGHLYRQPSGEKPVDGNEDILKGQLLPCSLKRRVDLAMAGKQGGEKDEAVMWQE